MAKLSIPITKAKGVIDIDTDAIPVDVYTEALLQGFKVLLNRGASKVTKAAFGSEEELKAEAMRIANEQLELVMTSKIRFTGGKAKRASGAVMTEARRLAKAMVKDAMKAAKMKISHYEASEITKAANALLDSDPSIIEQAKVNLEARAQKPVAIDVSALIQESPKLVEKAAKKKAEAKTQLSAKQAGKVQKHKGQQAAAH